jgi:hypothetical protein
MDGKDRENKPKQRLKSLFSKEKKVVNTEDVNDFLYGTPTDKLEFADSALAPPSTSQQQQQIYIDTATAQRWPTAAEVQKARGARGRSASPKRSRKGLVVKFTDEQPEIIGYGGDFAESPTINLRNRAHTHPGSRDQYTGGPGFDVRHGGFPSELDGFQSGPIQRTHTGHASIPERMEVAELDSTPLGDQPTQYRNPSSFAARVQREMRADEGRALMEATLNPPSDELFLKNDSPGTISADIHTILDELQLNTMKNANIPPSGPSNLPDQLTPGRSPTETTAPPFINRSHTISRPSAFPAETNDNQDQRFRSATVTSNFDSPPMLSRSSTLSQGAAGHDALNDFASRIVHLFTLFRLSTESVRPLTQCSPEEIIRAAMWWFLRGRLNLEATIRDRPTSPEAQQTIYLVRQQAYADLAKAWWIIETVMPQLPQFTSQGINNPRMADIQDAQQNVLSGLRKLAMSMTRNNFLPPEDAPLPQGLDNSIFVPEDGAHSFLMSVKQYVATSISEPMPLGDTSRAFHYGRLFADAVLMEEGEAQQYRFPVLLSLFRNRKEKEPTGIITNQNGTLCLCIQGENSQGPGWDDVTWHVKSSTIDIKRLRGFLLRLHCAPQDFRTLFGTFDHQRSTCLALKPRQDEAIVFQSNLRTFQYFDQDPNSTFPKEALPQCQLKLFEKILLDKSKGVGRAMHRGFRIGLVTSSTSKTLRGVNQELPTTRPLQLGFLRGEDGFPALLVKIDDTPQRYTMVFTFEDVEERSQLYAKLTGTLISNRDMVVSEIKLKALAISGADSEEYKGLLGLKWQNTRLVSEEEEDLQNTAMVRSRRLRIIMEFRIGCLVDRMALGSGDIKLRLGVSTSTELKILRQPQQDLTISVSESQAPKEMPSEITDLLTKVARSTSIRTYTFPRLVDLHEFQAAITGFTVVFDGLAASFNISRRRMVVPIYKKWDAATTRVQLVRKDKTVQLVAFFENFAHGESMNFMLKSTDIFEHFGRNGKFSLRIVDAKFPLPKGSGDGEGAIENGFVCIDQVEYPGEHDDITIVFDSDAGKFGAIQAPPIH